VKILAITNPASNFGRAKAQTSLARQSIGKDMPIEWIETDRPLHAQSLAQDATRLGYGCIIAGGGDGTVNEVVNGIMEGEQESEARPVLGIMPLGAGNDFYAAVTDDGQTAHSAGLLPGLGFVRWVDIGHATLDQKYTRYFCLGVGVGLIGWSNLQRIKMTGIIRGHVGYLLASAVGLLTYRSRARIRLDLDGKPICMDRMVSMVMLQNGRSVGGGFIVTPGAEADDGEIDVCVIDFAAKWRLARLILKARHAAHVSEREVTVTKAHHILLDASCPLPVHIDGELPQEVVNGVSRVAVSLLPTALKAIALRL